MLEVGTVAPDFTLPDKEGNPVTLSQFRGKRVVVYFYPRDNTPGCTRQACGYAAAYDEFQALDTVVIGISKDYNVFELQAALINRDVLKANRIVRYFGDNKKANPLVVVLAQLFNFFANLMLYHYLPDKSQMAVASELKVNPYFVRDYERASRVFNAWKTMYIISYIRDTDARAKGIDNASADDGELLKELVYKILH